MTSKPGASDKDDYDLMQSAFKPSVPAQPTGNKKDKGEACHLNNANLAVDTGVQDVCFLPGSSDSFPCLDDMAWLDYSVLGTSEEQQQLMTEKQEELQQSIKVKCRKEEAGYRKVMYGHQSNS